MGAGVCKPMRVATFVAVSGPQAPQLLGSTDPTLDWAAIARTFAAAGVRDVVVTLGARGSMVIQGGPEHLPVLTPIPAGPTQVVDTTGCGDRLHRRVSGLVGPWAALGRSRAESRGGRFHGSRGPRCSRLLPHYERGEGAPSSCLW